MPVRLLRPYNGQNVGTIYSGPDESILRATGTADDYVELATNYVPTGSSSFRAYATSFSLSSPAGAIVAALTDPFRGQGRGVTTYATTGTVPGQLALNNNTVTVGGTAGVAGTVYTLSVIATSGDGSQSVTGTFNFKAVSFSYNAGTPGYSGGSSGPVTPVIPPIVLPTASLRAAMTDLTNAVSVYAQNASIAIDTTVPGPLGSSTIGYTGKGTGDFGSFQRNNLIPASDTSDPGVISWWKYNDPLDPFLYSTETAYLRQGTTSFTGPTQNVNPIPGGAWFNAHVSEFTNAGATITPGIQTDLRLTEGAGGNMPVAHKINIGPILTQAAGIPIIMPEGDDGYYSQFLYFLQDMKAAGLVGSLNVTPNNYLRGNNAGFMTLAQVQQFRAAGWGMVCDSSMDDSQFTSAADIETAMNGPAGNKFDPTKPGSGGIGLNAVRQYIKDNGLQDGFGGENHIGVAQGAMYDLGTASTSNTVTFSTDGGANVTLSAAFTRTPVVGDLAFGPGIARGVNVKTVTDTTHVVLQNADGSAAVVPNPGTTNRIMFRQAPGAFPWDAMAQRLKTEGFLTARISADPGRGWPTRYGLGGRQYYLPWYSMAGNTNTFAGTYKPVIDKAIQLGNSIILGVHGNAPKANPDTLNSPQEETVQTWMYLAQLQAQGKCLIMPRPLAYSKYWTKPDTVPAS
jgi:hypothetical protein